MPPPNHHDAGPDSPIHQLLPRYTCPFFYADCGGGYCCPPAQSCQNGGSDTDSIPTCHLGPPGLLGSDSPAQLAPGVSSSSSSSLSPSSSSSSSSSTSSSTPSSTSMTLSSPTSTSTPAAASASATAAPTTNGTISGSGIGGIVVGVVVLLALAGGSAWSLVRRRRREREREASLLPADGSGRGSAGPDCLAGFFGAGRKEGEAGSPEMRQQQQQQPSPRRSLGAVFRKIEDAGRGPGRPSFGPEWGDGLVYMYGGSNVGRTPGEVPGRVEALGDVPVQRPPPAIPRKKVGSQRKAPVYEMEGSPASSASP